MNAFRQLISRQIPLLLAQSAKHWGNLNGKLGPRSPKRGKLFASPLILVLLLLLWCGVLGVGLAQAIEPDSRGAIASAQAPFIAQVDSTITSTTDEFGTVDAVPANYQLGQELYLENCASCHVGLPPQILPTNTWRSLLQDAQHYGVQITPLRSPALQLVWNYVQTFSRPIIPNEQIPYRIRDSRYFKALHPRVEFSTPVEVDSCVSCHPNALQYNFRRLTPEWQDAP